MIKKSITIKLFLFILILFLLQLLIQVSFQNYFMADFYENKKIDSVNKVFDETIKAFKETDNLEEQIQLLSNYTDETEEPILVFNDYFEYHEASYQTSFERTLSVDIQGEIHSLPLSDYIDENSYMIDLTPDMIGEEVIMTGYSRGKKFYPLGVDYQGNFLYTMSLEDEEKYIDDFYDQEDKLGIIVDYDELQLSNRMVSKLDVLTESFFSEYLDEEINFDESLYEFIEKTEVVDGEIHYFITMISLQPINEVMAVQSMFQGYLFLGMTLLIFVVGYALSKVVSKPIVEMAETAQKIANLNFDVSCDDSRSDEIGLLAKSLNHLSDSLKLKIEDLEKTNAKLEDEIEFERRQDKIRKEFVANVSHELKTPLGVIKSYSEGLKDGISKDKESYYMDVIVEEVNKMNLLISDMLQLSNLESGIQKLDLESINLKRMLQNLLRPYEKVIEEAQLKFDVVMDDVFLDVEVRKMESVFSNILSNAFRYVDENKKLFLQLNEEGFVLKNTSDCLSDEDMNKLFDRFYRVEKSRDKKLGGNGLGLAIVKNILDLHEMSYEVSHKKGLFIFKISFSVQD